MGADKEAKNHLEETHLLFPNHCFCPIRLQLVRKALVHYDCFSGLFMSASTKEANSYTQGTVLAVTDAIRKSESTKRYLYWESRIVSSLSFCS